MHPSFASAKVHACRGGTGVRVHGVGGWRGFRARRFVTYGSRWRRTGISRSDVDHTSPGFVAVHLELFTHKRRTAKKGHQFRTGPYQFRGCRCDHGVAHPFRVLAPPLEQCWRRRSSVRHRSRRWRPRRGRTLRCLFWSGAERCLPSILRFQVGRSFLTLYPKCHRAAFSLRIPVKRYQRRAMVVELCRPGFCTFRPTSELRLRRRLPAQP